MTKRKIDDHRLINRFISEHLGSDTTQRNYRWYDWIDRSIIDGMQSWRRRRVKFVASSVWADRRDARVASVIESNRLKHRTTNTTFNRNTGCLSIRQARCHRTQQHTKLNCTYTVKRSKSPRQKSVLSIIISIESITHYTSRSMYGYAFLSQRTLIEIEMIFYFVFLLDSHLEAFYCRYIHRSLIERSMVWYWYSAEKGARSSKQRKTNDGCGIFCFVPWQSNWQTDRQTDRQRPTDRQTDRQNCQKCDAHVCMKMHSRIRSLCFASTLGRFIYHHHQRWRTICHQRWCSFSSPVHLLNLNHPSKNEKCHLTLALHK